MERRVSVNDHSDADEQVAFDEMTWPSEPPGQAEAGYHGPCLYLGESGERCGKPAIAGGYCAKHHPDEDKRWPGRSYSRVLVASVALILVIWPYIDDAIHLIVRLIHELQPN